MSADQFVVNTLDCLPTGCGLKSSYSQFHGGTLHNDSATVIIWVENQLYLGASETFLGKESSEKWVWEQSFFKISQRHSDNGIFASDLFRLECDNRHQEQYLSRV